MAALRWAEDATLLYVVAAALVDQTARRAGKLDLSGITDLPLLLGKSEPYRMLFVSPRTLREPQVPDLSSFRCLVNLITEPEHNAQALRNLGMMLKGFGGKVVNRPEAVLRSGRDEVAGRLAGVPGLLAPQVVRFTAENAAEAIARAGLRFPAILRKVGTHSGKIAGRFDRPVDIPPLPAGIEHIATQFVDFQSSDGLYRKYRVFFFGRHIIFRHMLVSDDWDVHARDRQRFMADRPDLLEEEMTMFASERPFPPEVHRVLEQVRDRMMLDFFGMDFGIAADGRVVLFEANATMNFFPFLDDPRFHHVLRSLAPARQAYRQMLGLPPAVATGSAPDAVGELAR